MTTPTQAPATDQAVIDYLKLSALDGGEAAALTAVVNAVNDVVRDRKGALPSWPPRYVQGAVMLAARVYRRRNSPGGVEAFGELGPVYVSRNDPDVAVMLDWGAHTRPVVG